MADKEFRQKLAQIAVPVTVQALMQSSLSLIDQIMIGFLGSESIAGIGLAGKFTSLYSVTAGAIVTVAGILIAQYVGSKDSLGVRDSFYLTLYPSLLLMLLFSVLSACIPAQVMSLYSDDAGTVREAAAYLRWRAPGYLPVIVTLFASVMLRNMNRARLPAAAGIAAILSDTLLNWLLIFGKAGFPRLGATGAALATSISQLIEMLIVVVLFLREKRRQSLFLAPTVRFSRAFIRKAAGMLVPILAGEFLWALGENMYAVIYGHLGTESCAAMTLMYPIQGIAIGALGGIATASGIIVGNSLGAGDETKAYADAKSFVRLTLSAGIVLGILVCAVSPLYVRLFNVSRETQGVTIRILAAFALVFPAKVFNMVVGGGVLQAGGQTKFMTAVNIIGTWGVGVPLGFLSAYALKLPIWHVYLLLSLEEYVRLAISVALLTSRRWMRNITR